VVGSKGKALAVEQELRRGASVLPDKTAPLIKDLVPDWLAWYQHEVRPSTFADATNSLRHWLPVLGMYRPANITRQTIEDYKAERLKLVSKRTINKELVYLSGLLKWAANHGHCPDMTFRITGFPAKQTKTITPIVLTPRQIDAMLQQIEPVYRLLFLLMADMGLRRAEALSLAAEDVDEYHQTISVVGKGGKQRILPWTTERFTAALKEALDKHHTGPLTVNPETGRQFVQIKKMLDRAAADAGIKTQVYPHLLRHSCLSNLAMRGLSPHALQQFAGHSSVETTNKIYVHVSQDYVGAEVRKIMNGG
jgi:integrase